MLKSSISFTEETSFGPPKIEILWDTVAEEVLGQSQVEGVKIRNKVTGETRILPVQGLFIFIGIRPQTEWLQSVLDLDEQGFIITDAEMRTSVPGVFAAGDVRSKACRQIVTAAGDGATAAYMAEHYLAQREKV